MKCGEGDEVEIVNNIIGHPFEVGDVVTIEECLEDKSGNPFYRAVRDDGEWGHVNDDEIQKPEKSNDTAKRK